MKEKQIQTNLLDIVFEKIVSGIDSIKDMGLLTGKTGAVLFLYRYAQNMRSEKAEELADAILDELWESLSQAVLTHYFYTGHSGIAWALSVLGRESILDIDDTVNPYLEGVDFYMFREQKNQIPVPIDPDSGMFSSGLYLLSRSALPGLSLAGNCHWREQAIYLIEDCERILYRQTAYGNVFLPAFTLPLLNSILYFLIKVHQQRIYPYKTNILIPYIYQQIQELIEQAEIQDVVTSHCLLLQMKDEFSFSSMDLTANHLIQDPELDILAEAGRYTLLYDNKSIFNEVYSYMCHRNSGYVSSLFEELVKDKEIPVKILLGIGYGLLAVTDNK